MFDYPLPVFVEIYCIQINYKLDLITLNTHKMKRLTSLLFAILVFGCNTNHEKSELIMGTWDCISVFDFETQEISRPPSGEKLIVEFKSDGFPDVIILNIIFSLMINRKQRYNIFFNYTNFL